MNIPVNVKVTKEEVKMLTRGHRNVNGVALARVETPVQGVDKWSIVVNLVKEHKWWHRKLPGLSLNGVPIEYRVIGPIRAHS